jgi:hypothetical protein
MIPKDSRMPRRRVAEPVDPLEPRAIAGLRVLGEEQGLPRLPDLEFAIYEKTRPDKAATALAATLLALGQGPSLPTI